MLLAEYPEHIRQKYANGYFNYCVTITFKRDNAFSILHPKKAHDKFKNEFTKYALKKGADFIMFPEISKAGALHYHGLLLFKSSDYTIHEKMLRLFRNYCSRKYGFHNFQRIYSLFTDYEVADIRNYIRKRSLTTSFERIFNYITKDHYPNVVYGFLNYFTNI